MITQNDNFFFFSRNIPLILLFTFGGNCFLLYCLFYSCLIPYCMYLFMLSCGTSLIPELIAEFETAKYYSFYYYCMNVSMWFQIQRMTRLFLVI